MLWYNKFSMGKNIFILLTFDDETTKRLQAFKEELYAFDVHFDYNHPHITIANYPGINTVTIKKYAEHFFKKIKPFPIILAKLALIDKHLLVIEPIDNSRLNEIHHTFHEAYDEYSTIYTTMKDGKYMPHITLHYDLERDLKPIFEELAPKFVSFTGFITGVEVSQINDNGFKILRRILLKGA